MKYLLFNTFIFLFVMYNSNAQKSNGQYNFTVEDSTRGYLDGQRAAFDVYYYDLTVDLKIPTKSIRGKNDIYFDVVDTLHTIQIDLFDHYDVTSCTLDDEEISFSRRHNALFIALRDTVSSGQYKLSIAYQGQVVIAKRAPWDGGFVFDKDKSGKDWVGVACEGFGASSWWPLKDHLSDEPDSMTISIITDEDLMAVSNGNLKQTMNLPNNRKVYQWHVSYPINSYNVTLNIANYAHFNDNYVGFDSDTLILDYYVLPENIELARTHFTQSKGVLEAYEHYFGKYPFWEDGFALVETPFLGMEHQSAIAYGNEYKKGYLGTINPDILEFDYIIVHETGHEYWGNSISVSDHGDMWIHESFTTYMEALYVEYHYNTAIALDYLLDQRNKIFNTCPIKGPTGVNFQDFCSADMYYKGSWILHTLRTILGDDDIWWELLKSLYQENKYSVINTCDIIEFMNPYFEIDIEPILSQYLDHKDIPILEYKKVESGKQTYIYARWNVAVKNFIMPVWVHNLNATAEEISLNNHWKLISSEGFTDKEPIFDTRIGLFEVKRID